MSDPDQIYVSYTNWRGKTSVRRIVPGEIRFGTSEWHPEPTWLLSAFDLDHPAQIWKEFDLTHCDFADAGMVEAQAARIADLEKALGELLEQVRKAKSPDVSINMRDWRVSMDNAAAELKGQTHD